MKCFTRLFGVAAIALATMLVSTHKADAGRVGGPATVTVTLAPGQLESVDVPFAAGERAIISLDGYGATSVEVFVYDGDGHVHQPVIMNGRKVVIIDVYREGLFRIEVRNAGGQPSTFRVSTN